MLEFPPYGVFPEAVFPDPDRGNDTYPGNDNSGAVTHVSDLSRAT